MCVGSQIADEAGTHRQKQHTQCHRDSYCTHPCCQVTKDSLGLHFTTATMLGSLLSDNTKRNATTRAGASMAA